MKRGELSEKVIENQVLSWFKLHGIMAWKIKSTATYDPTRGKFLKISPWYRRGCPDVLACYHGRLLGFEIKTKIGRLSEHQKSFHEDLRRAGGLVYIVRDVSDLADIFRELKLSLRPGSNEPSQLQTNTSSE